MIEVTEADRDHYYEKGYVVYRGVLSREQVESVKTGIQRMIDRAKSGEGQDLPWVNKEQGIPGRFDNVFSPPLFQPEIGETIESMQIVDIAEELLESPVRFCAAGVLAGGDGKSYRQAWHRDITTTEGPSQINQLTKYARHFIQLNGALFYDSFLKIVPGSHIRATTVEELDVLRNNPMGEMPGEVTMELEPGDIVFYYNNLLHKGFNPEGKLRWTLHYGFRSQHHPLTGEQRQGPWLNHTVDLSLYPARTRLLLERYLAQYDENIHGHSYI